MVERAFSCRRLRCSLVLACWSSFLTAWKEAKNLSLSDRHNKNWCSEKEDKKARALTHFNETISCKLYSHCDLLQACQCPNSVLMRPMPPTPFRSLSAFLPPGINRWKCPPSSPAIASLPPSAAFPRSKTFFLLLGYENSAQNSTGRWIGKQKIKGKSKGCYFLLFCCAGRAAPGKCDVHLFSTVPRATQIRTRPLFPC